MTRFTLTPQGPFSLRESAEFGFGQRHAVRYAGVMRLAMTLDGYGGQVAVALRQAADDEPVEAEVTGRSGSVDDAAVQAQVARVLSLDRDASGFADVGRRDEVIGRLQQVAHGLRPPLFHSPYEAAAWSIISARRSQLQMARVRDRLAATHGTVFPCAGEEIAAFPTPEKLLAVEAFPGLNEEKLARLHAVAEAALDGRLEVARLLELGPEEAHRELMTLPGIGPFYASLIVLRATGWADIPVTEEPRALAALGELYGLGGSATPAQMLALSDAWRPWRTWCTVLVRAASGRLVPAAR